MFLKMENIFKKLAIGSLRPITINIIKQTI